MQVEVGKINTNKCNMSRWGGGTTTELSIYPENSKYSERNFLYRISTATCDDEKSVFTNLPGIKRELMILRGKVILQHEGRYSKNLNSYDKDTFCGEWKTISYGQCTDFNLMMSKECTGSLEHLVINNSKEIVINKNKDSKNIAFGFYIYEGKLDILYNKQTFNIEDKDMLMFRAKDINEEIKLKIASNKEVDVVFIEISY